MESNFSDIIPIQILELLSQQKGFTNCPGARQSYTSLLNSHPLCAPPPPPPLSLSTSVRFVIKLSSIFVGFCS
ncbi:hypothetical protein L2E82_48334 [Cichorium intybus]|uniref:Uncharacterized protein n=1 Tax=Cichorium intybus TaxID=13427 RepID=A0ACB8YZ11_CICIN|nr:hypothetical protein L2E82_48334 [Cichorium intybus]